MQPSSQGGSRSRGSVGIEYNNETKTQRRKCPDPKDAAPLSTEVVDFQLFTLARYVFGVRSRRSSPTRRQRPRLTA
ncbi:hypothetical protein EVAR_12164_1 [Eumeta japonica]|uniref:Uncharacterized protein n=1 Tax=Eumeta variegata TaxID=151549 RepID=A0A4C1UIA9_EUMVA|nr:hypothetical protein EVAR_12164_1 [Eumeta japonica]